ncbi:MAG: ribonuclease HII [Clostridiales bacterium]|nr:ribonuclease HII [Clostridiales bacterium]
MTDTLRLFDYDRAFFPDVVAGMDEAGRGPLAGPVVAACVVMPLDTPISGIYDSKKVSEKNRERLYEEIIRTATAYGVGVVDNKRIDAVNILNATREAMRQAYESMRLAPHLLLVDAVTNLDLRVPTRAIVKGDATSYNIAAASIVAKVTRDRMMRAYNAQYPAYGFVKNKGYGTSTHIAALQTVGKCPLHRNTFIGRFVKETACGKDEVK